MALKYKINVLDALKEKGYTSYILRKEKLLSESTIQKLREGEGVAWDNLDTLCRLMECDICDLLEYQKEEWVFKKSGALFREQKTAFFERFIGDFGSLKFVQQNRCFFAHPPHPFREKYFFAPPYQICVVRTPTKSGFDFRSRKWGLFSTWWIFLRDSAKRVKNEKWRRPPRRIGWTGVCSLRSDRRRILFLFVEVFEYFI